MASKNVEWHALYFHANNSADITTHPQSLRFHASDNSHSVDLVEILLARHAQSLPHDGKTDLQIIRENRSKIRCKLAFKVVNRRSIFDFNSPF